MSKPPWNTYLSAEAVTELKEMGRLLYEARRRRNITRIELSRRLGVDPRTLVQLEKGSPKVSLGIFFQALSALNLLRGMKEVARPENDIEAIADSLRRIRTRKPLKKAISDKEVDF